MDEPPIQPQAVPHPLTDRQTFYNRFPMKDAENFTDVNNNFDTIHEMGFSLFAVIRENAQITNQNMTRMAEETNANLNKMAGELKALVPANYMAVTIGIIMLGFISVTITAIFKLAKSFLSF